MYRIGELPPCITVRGPQAARNQPRPSRHARENTAPIPLYAQGRPHVPPITSPNKMEVAYIFLIGQYICFNKVGHTIPVIAACNIIRFVNRSRNCISNRYASAAHLNGFNIIVIITKIDRFSF